MMITVENFGIATTRSADYQILCVRAVNLVWLVCGITYGAKSYTVIDYHVMGDIYVNFYKFSRSILVLQEPLICPLWPNSMHFKGGAVSQFWCALLLRAVMDPSACVCVFRFKDSLEYGIRNS